MTDKIEQKVVDILDALQSGAVEIGGKVVKYAPDIADTVLLVTRVNGIQTLFSSLVFGVLLGVCSVKLWAWAAKEKKEDKWSTPADGIYFLSGFSLLLSALSFAQLIRVWTWVQVFEPKLYIAKQIIDSALSAGGAK